MNNKDILIQKVREMRHWQLTFFRSHPDNPIRLEAKANAMRLEREVDKMLETLKALEDSPQQAIFDHI